MKKLMLLTVLLVLGLTFISAQTIAEYTFSTTADGTLQDMTGSTNLLTAGTYYDDTASAVTNIGFSFSLGLGTYTQFSANSNGQMQLGATAISGGAASPAANTPRLAPLSGDNAIRATGKLHYLLVGTAPNRKLVVEWLDLRVPYSSATETGTYCRMQAWLYEGSNNIKFVYGTMWNMGTSASARGIYVSTSNVAGSIGQVTDVIGTMTWNNSATSVTTTSFPLSSAMTNLNSAADGSRRVFNINYPVYTTPPNTATLLSPANGNYVQLTDVMSWQSGGGGATSYDVYFGTSATPPFVVNQASTTYAPTLAAGTTYYWNIVAKNAYGDAAPTATWSFRTPTATQLQESFESTTFPPAGWARITSNTSYWGRSTSQYKHGAASMYVYTSTTTPYNISTPKLTIVNGSKLNFWTFAGATSQKLQILYSTDRTSWTQLGSDITYAAASTWYNIDLDLTSLAGGNYYLAFNSPTQTTGYQYIYVDLVIGPSVTPEAPGPVTLSLPADAAINVSEYPTFTWTAPVTGGAPTGYAVYCSTTNPPNYTTDLIGSTGAGVLSFTATTALAYNTTYYWTVKAFNTTGDATIPTPRSFTTRANPTITTLPFTEGFETGNTDAQPVALWSSVYVTGTKNWTANSTATSYNRTPRTGSFNAFLGWSASTWMIRPVQLTGGTSYDVEVFARQDNADTALANMTIAYGTSGTAAGMTNIIVPQTGLTNGDYQRLIGSFTPPSTGVYYIGILGTLPTATNWYVSIDDITIRETPATPIFSVTPAAWDFGQTLINTTPTKQFTISNNGGGTLDISSIGISGSYYTLTVNPAPVTLGASQSATFTVQYAPTVAGTHEGTVTITDNRAVTTVDLDGVCVDPSIYYANLPYTQNFDGVTAPALPFGWSKVGTTGTVQTQTTSPNSAPNCVYIYTPATTLALPPVNMATETALRMKFWARGNYTAGDALIVGYLTNPTDASTFTPIQSVTMAGLTYAQYQVTLGSVTGIKYYAIQAGTLYYSMLIDDVVIEEVPPVPVFSYTPTSINFGSVMQNVAATAQNITITNTGGGTLNIGAADISITGPQSAMFSYVATNLPAALGAGQSVVIPVTVTVTQQGPVSATLTISNSQTRTNYDVDLSATGLPAGIVVIGNGTANNNLPINPFYGYTYSQSIFLQSEINVPNQRIESVYYYWNGVAEAVDSNDWTIYMGHTAATEFASTTDWIPLANLSTVFTGTVALPATAGWIEIPLTAPFIYNNTDNLVIAVDENAPSYDGSSEFFYSTAAATNRSLRYYNDSTNPDPAAPVAGTLVLAFPNVMLQLGDIPTGMPDPVVITSPANETTGLPIDGFDITWTPALTGGVPTYYAVFMSQDETTIYDDLYWETTNTSFNPVTDGGVTFDYLDRWYFTVQAFNLDGDALVDPPYWFEIEDAPQVITTFPWVENFDLALTPPADWTVSDVDGAGTNWVGSTTNVHSAPNAFKHGYSTAVPDPGQNGWLITPAIQVPAGNYYLSWWNYNVFPTWMVYNGVKVNTTNDPAAAGWTEIWSQATAASAWSQAVVNISAYAGQTVYFAFNYQGYDGDDWYIDDVSVYELLVDTFGPVITTLPHINTPREDLSYLVYAEIADDATWNNPIGGANLYYSIDAGATWSAPVAMTLDVAPGYYAYIPAQALGTSVQYYIQAWDSLNNMTTTDTFTFGVNDPTWIWYDQGGTTYLGYTTTNFGPTVLFNNPFYGTGNAMQLLGTDGSSYYGNAANLQVSTFDGTTITPYFTTPIPVTFGAQTYETFDLTSYNVQISTEYFLVSYLDVPMGNYILFDSTYDYGTTYVYQGTTLYTMSNSGSWCIGANVQTGASLALDAPVVTVATGLTGIDLSWGAVDGANGYKVLASSDPYAADPWAELAYITGTSYTYTGTDDLKFFKVRANSDAPTTRNNQSILSAPARINVPASKATNMPKGSFSTRNRK